MADILNVQQAADGTRKYLFRFTDGVQIETVRMHHPYGTSVCVSSQAGCSMGCAFCASGLRKKQRNLTAEEMLLQIALSGKEGECATHAVVMGTGEPFDNLDEVLRFLDIVSDEARLRRFCASYDLLPDAVTFIAPRHLTVSTCGLLPGIQAFAHTEKRYNLAISLHAPTDALRNRLMPVNRRYPLNELIEAAAEYCFRTKRRAAFEYLLLEGVNNRPEDAEALCALLTASSARDFFYVNLIPFNQVPELPFRTCEKEAALRFYDLLMKRGVKATLRKERGSDIAAACGQLRLSGSNGETCYK